MKKIALVLTLVMAVVMVAGCGDKVKAWRPEGSPGYIDMEGKKFLIMPADMRYLPGDKDKLGAALFAGFIAEFGVIACFIGLLFTMMWAYLVIAHVLGQVHRESLAVA